MSLRLVVASAALLSIMLPVLGGCVSQVQLADQKGETAQCNAAGVGIIGAAMAASGQKDCIERYEKQGYRQVPLPAAADATPSSTAAAAKTAGKTAGKTASKTAKKGPPTQCNTYGGGIVGSLIATSMQQTCEAGSATAAPASSGQPKQ